MLKNVDFIMKTGSADASCRGVEEMQHFYRQAISNLQLYGPTNFAEFIQTAADTACVSQVSQVRLKSTVFTS